jgi:hypothetical protein
MSFNEKIISRSDLDRSVSWVFSDQTALIVSGLEAFKCDVTLQSSHNNITGLRSLGPFNGQ